MRLLMQIVIPVEKGNAAASDGSLQKAFDDFVTEAKPEAAYFFLREGKRAAFFVFEEESQKNLIAHNEKMFVALDAEISIQPVLSHGELSEQL
ncbi:hypothetical protein [Microbulbifer pacificus]|uniref:hypothetical protein n=1 Tax=Microbulbifer pacificus TaxID=407164 RepID=UPI00131A00AE|nr:hypothetical protein [Microbulbifer pacificus]